VQHHIASVRMTIERSNGLKRPEAKTGILSRLITTRNTTHTLFLNSNNLLIFSPLLTTYIDLACKTKKETDSS
jgi:hypothetical protein